jgi:hypothetical protein
MRLEHLRWRTKIAATALAALVLVACQGGAPASENGKPEGGDASVPSRSGSSAR